MAADRPGGKCGIYSLESQFASLLNYHKGLALKKVRLKENI